MTRRNILKPKNCLTIGIKTTAVLLGCVVILASQSQQNCHAQGVFDWTNTTSSNSFWDISGNWTPGGPPGSADTASFLLNASYKVSFDDLTIGVSPDVGFIDILDGNVTFSNEQSSPLAFTVNEQLTLSGGTTNLTLDGLNLSVGTSTNILNGANLTIDGSATSGTSFSSASTNLGEGQLIFQSGTQGTLGGPVQINVNKADAATMRISSLSQVTSGDIEIGNGASQSASSSGSLIVNGPGATLTMNPGATLEIGNTDGLGSHSVNVDSFGLLEMGDGNININASGVLNVSNGQVSSTGDLLVDGAINIESGGTISNGDVTTGSVGSVVNTLKIDGAGSRWTTGRLTLGSLGRSTLNIQTGGVLNSSSSRLGGGNDDNFAAGTVNVSGANSQWNNAGDMVLGSEDDGFSNLQVSGGALVTSGSLTGFAGTVSVSGSGSRLQVNNEQSMGAAALQIFDGGFASASSASISRFGTIQSTGTWNINNELFIGNETQLNIGSGGIVESGSAVNEGTVNVTGEGSQWNTAGSFSVGMLGDGTLNIQTGSSVSSGDGTIGGEVGSTGVANIQDVGSRWSNIGQLTVGGKGSGTLIVEGGLVANALGRIAQNPGSTGLATVTGTGSRWQNGGNLVVGTSGNGTLNLESEGVATSFAGHIGGTETAIGVATVSGINSHWENSSDLFVGTFGNGTLNVEAGGLVTSVNGTVGSETNSEGRVTVTGPGSHWNISGDLIMGKNGFSTVNIRDGGRISSQSGSMSAGSNSVRTVIDGTDSTWQIEGDLVVGETGLGFLELSNDGRLNNTNAVIGEQFSADNSIVRLRQNAQWINSGALTVGLAGDSVMEVDGAQVASATGAIGAGSGRGFVAVGGVGGSWEITGDLTIGDRGHAELRVFNDGILTNTNSIIGKTQFSQDSVVDVTGLNARWINSGNLTVGLAGDATLNVENGGLVTVGDTTFVGSQGIINLSDGRFEFNETTLTEFNRINATGGVLAGNVNHSGFTDVANATALNNAAVDLSEVSLTNSGTLFGAGSVDVTLFNATTGEVEAATGERFRFTNLGNRNDGEVNLLGGQVRFEHDLINTNTGFVGGFGSLIANGGLINKGDMAFSGRTDIFGDVTNETGGQIVTSGGVTTTFFDDILHNGTEIRTSAGSKTVIFGAASGDGAYTGAGTVFFEGDLRPGNSPGVVDMEGSVVFGSFLNSEFELGGLQLGEFDRLNVGQDLFLDGELSVSLIDDFELGLNQEFLIADVGGDRLGFFNGLNEGSLVGNFGGRSLFITYNAGRTGNGVALFTPVPEPGSIGLLGLIGIGLVVRRRKRSMLRR